jgi:hypothetical protein
MLTKLLLATTLFAFTACGVSVAETPINQPPAPMTARPSTSVELFTSGPPARPHVDVAMLQADPQSGLANDSTDNLISTLRERAGSMGCDGLVVTQVNNQLVKNGGERQTVNGTCIMWSK